MKWADFVSSSNPPAAARRAAADAALDTIGVTLAGASEPCARIVQRVVASEGGGECRVLGTNLSVGAAGAALANGTAAHAHDFDDMCFVSLAHPSAPLVSSALAAAESAAASGRMLLDAYVVGFEIEARLGRAMNPRHYERGWHCTSTIGTIGAAAAASRVLGLDPKTIDHALRIAASEASGLKGNFGSMVKPLHAGLAARNGVLAARLAQGGMTAGAGAIEGPQGLLAVMDAERDWHDLRPFFEDLGARWEILDNGITVKLYPSCAATHPSLDVLLDLRRREQLTANDVEAIDVGVDHVTPTVLIHDCPADGLQAKFSMKYCAAAALVCGRIGLDTFEDAQVGDREILGLLPRVTMRVDPTLDPAAPPLTQARVTITLKDGRVLTALACGARGYPNRPASDQEMADKFIACARRAVSAGAAEHALEMARKIEDIDDVRVLTEILQA